MTPHSCSGCVPTNPQIPPEASFCAAVATSEANTLLDVNVYIVQAKLDVSYLVELFSLAEQHCRCLCVDAKDADIIITAITMRRRLERNVSWEVARVKAVVTPSWLCDSAKAGRPLPCHPYIALQDLREETVRNCPSRKKKQCSGYGCINLPSASRSAPPRPSSMGSPSTQGTTGSRIKIDEEFGTGFRVNIPENLLPPNPPLKMRVSCLNPMSRFSCQRASPLICPNQALAVELDIIKRSRTLEGEERSALSYARAISAIKAYPRVITSGREVERLPYLGPKILSLVEEFLEKGKINEARVIASSERFATLSSFSSISGIGPSTARRLYALGLRTLNDLETHYNANTTAKETQLIELEHNETCEKRSEGDLGEMWIRNALSMRQDLGTKIPRLEVEEMSRVIMHELDSLEPGCVSTIVGGYRRGKSESHDVDIVFTHPDPDKVEGLCKRFVRHLYKQGLVTHVIHLFGLHSHQPSPTPQCRSLQKALTVFILPQTSPLYSGTRRRLDLIFAHPTVYWLAVIGWSGSIMFQRDLRLWTKEKMNLKFDSSGITRLYDSKPFFPRTEKEAFDLCGLEWIDPAWRNADV